MDWMRKRRDDVPPSTNPLTYNPFVELEKSIMTTDEMARTHGIATDAVDPHEQPCTYILSPDGASAAGIPCTLPDGHAGNHIVQIIEAPAEA